MGQMDQKTAAKIRISLTKKYIEIQELIGFSLSIEKAYYETTNCIFASPIWGYPKTSITCDVFVIMPFAENFKPVYDDHILKVCKKLSLTCKRADDIFIPNTVMHDIWSLIHNSKLVVCDCTGKNANVFYELGIAHMLGKTAICITQSYDDIPFDISPLRSIKYEFDPRGMKKFERTLTKFIKESISDLTPLAE